ncbi:hypothetical protein Ancab_015989 [Ancistrocladus abbreviatus]
MEVEEVSSSSTLESARRGSRVLISRPRRGNARPRRSRVASSLRLRREETRAGPSSSMRRGTRGRGHARNNARSRLPENLTVDEEQEEAEEECRPNTRGTILCWLIDMNMVKENDEVHCFDSEHKRKVGAGNVLSGGIVCECCNQSFTASKFLQHERGDRVHRAYEKIFLSKANVPLVLCLLQAWNKQARRIHGGYHHVERQPGSADQYDDSCIICADGGGHELLVRIESVGVVKVKLTHIFLSKIHGSLEQMVGQRHQVDTDISWTLLRRRDEVTSSCSEDLYVKTKWNTKIAIASRTMENCFDPIIDRYSKINTIQNVVHNCSSNFTRLDFGRFYTAILEHKDEIVSVASVRIHGPKIAEMPCVATSESWRRQGMCNKLLSRIESVLCDLGVEYLTIPSAGEMVETWQRSFKFTAVDNDIEKQLAKLNTLTFPGSIRLQKRLGRCGQKISVLDLNLDPPEEE